MTEEPLASEKITTLEALSLAKSFQHGKELARTYSKEKNKQSSKKVNLSFDENNSKISKAEAQDLALALDIELLPASLVPDFATENLLSQKEATLILTRTLDLNGCYKITWAQLWNQLFMGKSLEP